MITSDIKWLQDQPVTVVQVAISRAEWDLYASESWGLQQAFAE